MTKSAYEAPVFRAHGKVEDLTKGGSNGTVLDQAFATGTPVSDLTFS